MTTLLEAFAGDELTFEVEVANEDPTAPAVNLTGAAIAVAFYRTPSLVDLRLDLAGGVQVVTATAPAVFLVTVSPAQSRLLTGKYQVEAKVRFPSGRVETVMRGRLKVGTSALLDMAVTA